MTAEEQYAVVLAAVIKRLTALTEAVECHARGHVTFGHVGDLIHVEQRLKELTEFLR
jgi:hypothetical protein